jgi:3-phosphoshikimate 1-carboxyvinyltransferase
MKEIKPKSLINTVVRVPGSKSITHRALIAASLAQGESLLEGFLACEDTDYTLETLQTLGAGITIRGQDAKIIGTGGTLKSGSPRAEMFIGNSGTSMRLLLSVVALSRGEFLLDGSPRMRQRPIEALAQALNQLGSDAVCLEGNGCPPVLVRARGIRGGRVTIPGKESSQYLSSLLLAGPYAQEDVSIAVEGELVSQPYVDMTLDVMKAFGVKVFRDGYRLFKVDAQQAYQPRHFSVEADVSNASYFLAGAAVTGGTVVIEGIDPFSTRQGDIRFLDVLEEMGCNVKKEKDRVRVRGDALFGIEADMSTMPDMVPTLAAVALFAEGTTIIRNVPHLRHKESDRLRAVRLEWERLGGKIEELSDGLIIHGGGHLSGTLMDPHDDHRLAMSLAVVGLRVPGIKIKDEDCVKKSSPQFWELWDRL